MYAYAATEAQIAAHNLLDKINSAILFPLITLLMAIALLVFLYGAFEYVKGASNDGDRETGKRHLLYGIIGMLVMLSAFTILTIAAATFDLDGELNKATDSGTFSESNFSSFNDDEDFSYNRAPSEEFYDEDETYEESEFIIDTQDEPASTESQFKKMEEYNFAFNEEKIRAAYGSEITYEQIIGSFSEQNGTYPDNYAEYENSELLSLCRAQGGDAVFSISINYDKYRQFYCVESQQ